MSTGHSWNKHIANVLLMEEVITYRHYAKLTVYYFCCFDFQMLAFH